jgi:hypothetical protein
LNSKEFMSFCFFFLSKGVMLYSLYQKVGDEWIANHRFPLLQAIASGKFIHTRYHTKVAVVPDDADPAPYLELVEKFA